MYWTSHAIVAGMLITLGPPGLAQTDPQAIPRTWLSDEDYPAEALRQGLQGMVVMLLTIDEKGRIGGCEISTSSGSQALDDASCRITMKSSRYRPATDAEGRRVPSKVTKRINWKLPG